MLSTIEEARDSELAAVREQSRVLQRDQGVFIDYSSSATLVFLSESRP